MDITKLIEISNHLNRLDIANDLNYIQERLEAEDKKIVLPLVGEFSSGKTSIINALMDNKKLETASKPTTATIFEIYFGNVSSYAEVVQGEIVERFENIEEVKNDSVSEKKLVRIYDTSTKVPTSTILVDTPGLSSSDPTHKIALTSYLPQSDGILLVTDVNQQITKSLLDFIETSKICKKPIYLIINKSDTKTESQIQSVKEYIAKEIQLNISNIACISATNGDLDELYALFATIQKNKNEIVNNALKERVNNIKILLSKYAKELLTNLSSASSLDSLIDDQDFKLKKINDNIDRLIRDASNKIEDKEYECKKSFENQISDKLERIVASQNRDNCGDEVFTVVNQTSNPILANFGKDIQSVLYNLARDRQSKIEAVPLQVLENLEMENTSFEFNEIGDISHLGHQWDKAIGYTAIAAATVATFWYTGGFAAVLKGGGNKVIKEGGKFFLVNSMKGNNNKVEKEELTEEKYKELIFEGRKKKLQDINNINSQFQQNTENSFQKNRGVIETSVGWITDNFLGKPQRKKAVRNYLESSVLPSFENQLTSTKNDLVRTIENSLREEARNSTLQMEEELKKLISKKETEKEYYNQKLAELKEYITILN